ncbi:MAG: cobalamin-dependent protein, partial [Kofleriaceae bacterium]|nr:cobalamin-dependent protein [Kofleriaceae bacterium]
MPRIILSTLNAKYAHCSLALRCLYANMGDLQEDTEIQEYIWSERACDLAEKILETQPEILGLGVYIWNAVETLSLVRILKSVAPSLVIVLGGPEVSHEYEEQELTELADYTVIGEGDLAFAEICREILFEKTRPEEKFIKGGEPKLAELVSPYSYYTDKDIKERSIYVEASRG